MINKAKMSQRIGLSVFVIGLVCIILAGCTKMDGNYKEFIKDGEIRYSQKPDTVGVYPGNNRVKVWFAAKRSDISKFKIYWNNRADSVEVPVVGTSGTDTLSTIIDNIAEGSYTFEFFTFDKEGNTSVVIDTTGVVYGDIYTSSITNRLVRSATLLNNEATVSWFNPTNIDAIWTEVRYKSQNGTDNLIKVGSNVNEIIINERPLKGSLKYRTLFLPHPHAIDTFYTTYLPITLEETYPGFPETFEEIQYVKSGIHSTEDVQIGSGLWRFDKFLIGAVAADRKNGARSVRSHSTENSSLEMLYDLPSGASKISFYHAICSSDGSTSFWVQYSKDEGTTWIDISEIHSTSTVLAYKEFELDIEEPIRFRFHQISTTTTNKGRSNIDDIDIKPN